MRCLVFTCLLALCAAQRWDWDVETPLDEYVNRVDPLINLEFIETENQVGATVYVYRLTSGRWVDEDYSNSPLWWHWLTVAIPTDARVLDTAHLYITGGTNTDTGPGSHNYIVDFARQTGAVAARLQQVPNQPISFHDSGPKFEDAIIARTWRHYIEAVGPPDPDWILQMPMTKAGKVAMDFVIEEVNSIDERFSIDKYIPTGISKRGWIAWLLAGVDPRVVGTCPTVLDILGWYENLHHHNMAYGGWSFAFAPYWNDQIPYYIEHPRSFEIFDEIGIDPLIYNPRMNMPKLLSIASMDEFFLPDDTHYFWDELAEPKYMTLYENTGHGMSGVGARRDANIMSFFMAVTSGFDMPQISWSSTETATEGWIDVTTDRTPNMIQAWWADTTTRTCESTGPGSEICRRDFRGSTADVSVNPVEFEAVPVEEMGGPGNNYQSRFDLREDWEDEAGFRGFFVQMIFDGVDDDHSLDFTTEIHIIQDFLPFPRCQTPDECQGVLK